MTVASLELCRELHELSGWADESLPPYYWTRFGSLCFQSGWYDGTILDDGEVLPAYDLGFLLRKLQDNDQTVVLRWNRDMGDRIGLKDWNGKYCVGTFYMPQGEYPIADTPDDAAAKLCIELFKQGILTKGVV